MLQQSEPVPAIPEADTEKSDKLVGLYQFETLPEVAKHISGSDRGSFQWCNT